MTPDELRTRSFTVAMRGYERTEVDRVVSEAAADLESLRARVEELEQRLSSASDESPGADPMDKYRSLGEQTTAILVQAETAARELREEAQAEADTLRREAAAHAEKVTGEADEHARTVRAEADAHARQVRDDADAEARAKVEDASRRAASEVAAAERAARERVETASAHARQIVQEAEARRDEVDAERARIDGVRAGLVAGLQAAVDAVGSEVDLLEQAPAPAPADAPEPAPQDPPEAPEAGGEGGTTRPVLDVVDDDADDDADDPPTDVAEVTADADPVAAPVDPAATADAPADQDTGDAGASGLDDPVLDDTALVDTPLDDAPAVDAPGITAPSPVAVAVTDAAVAAGREEPATSDEPLAPSMLRERSLAAVRPGMLRRLRRGLQELQNGALESLRERGRDIDAEALLPDEQVAEPLLEVARAFLDAAYRAGAGDAPVLRGGDPDPDAEADVSVVEVAAAGLAGGLVNELRTTLRPSLAAGLEADEADASLSERVGEVFRDLKGPVVEGLVDEHLTRVYGTAASAAWAAHGVEQVRWVLGEETRCPEGACRGNAGEDPQPIGGTFASGHVVPPVHEGCTCALAPV